MFKTFASMFETPAEEAARLARSPEGSTNHALSALPVTIHDPDVRGLVITLPRVHNDDPRTVTVVPIKHHPFHGRTEDGKRLRFDASWDCIIVHSNHDSYPVGGYDITVAEAQLRRGTVRDLSS